MNEFHDHFLDKSGRIKPESLDVQDKKIEMKIALMKKFGFPLNEDEHSDEESFRNVEIEQQWKEAGLDDAFERLYERARQEYTTSEEQEAFLSAELQKDVAKDVLSEYKQKWWPLVQKKLFATRSDAEQNTNISQDLLEAQWKKRYDQYFEKMMVRKEELLNHLRPESDIVQSITDYILSELEVPVDPFDDEVEEPHPWSAY